MPRCMEERATRWSQQRVGTTAEEEGQNKLDNYPNQVLTTNVWANGDCKVDYVSQGTLEGFPHPTAR